MRRTAIVVVALAVALAGCTSAGSVSPSPPFSPYVDPNPSPPFSPYVDPNPSPPFSPDPAPTPCPIRSSDGPLLRSRLVDVVVERAKIGDRVSFVFAPGEPSPGGQAEGAFGSAEPPFTAGASDLPLDVPGRRHVRLHFTNMVLYDETGTPTYQGPPRLDYPVGGVVRSVVEEEAFEGVVNWLIGFDGSGCVTLGSTSDGGVTVTVAAR